MNAPLLAVADLSIHAGRVPLLRDIAFALDAGESLTVVGESGAGKSLLAQAVMGTLDASLRVAGRVTLAGRASAAADVAARRPAWGRELALLPQEPMLALDPLLAIDDQLAEVARRVRRASRRQASAIVAAQLDAGGLTHAGRRHPWQLSGGMAQRAVAAMALAGGARIVVADEPTRGLDALWRERAVDRLKAVRDGGGCIVVITHDLRVAAALGGRLVVLKEGEVVEAGDAGAVLARPSHGFTRALIAAQPVRWPRFDAAPIGAPLIKAEGIAKDFGDGPLFSDVDLEIRRGSRLVVLGPSGVGKSTVGNLLVGSIEPDRGVVRRLVALERTRYQKLYQDPAASFPAHVGVGLSLRDATRLHRRAWHETERRLEALGIGAALLRRRPADVSGGELQRVALARVLVAEPVFVFADEPTSRLDALLQRDTMALLIRAVRELDAGLLLVTHDDDIATAVATDRLSLGEAAVTRG